MLLCRGFLKVKKRAGDKAFLATALFALDKVYRRKVYRTKVVKDFISLERHWQPCLMAFIDSSVVEYFHMF